MCDKKLGIFKHKISVPKITNLKNYFWTKVKQVFKISNSIIKFWSLFNNYFNSLIN